jgi:23S rRNA (guanosine2251-2'-O)-methyltransferase
MTRNKRRPMEVAALLHNVRSTHNVGSIFRTADSAGVSRVYLTGYTPTPRDRFGRAQKDIAKTALGAEDYVPWEYAKDPHSLIGTLKKEGWRIVGVEQDARANNYRSFKSHVKTLFIFGNEVRGLSQTLRRACDELVEIPMRGAMVRHAHHPRHTRRGKESLNVSVAAGVILFHTLR